LNLAVIIRHVRNCAQERTIAVFQLAIATLLPHHFHIRVIIKMGTAAAHNTPRGL
jgi:hypothetical protein